MACSEQVMSGWQGRRDFPTVWYVELAVLIHSENAIKTSLVQVDETGRLLSRGGRRVVLLANRVVSAFRCCFSISLKVIRNNCGALADVPITIDKVLVCIRQGRNPGRQREE